MNEETRIFVAAPWQDRPNARIVAQKLRDAGHIVDCRWLDLPDGAGRTKDDLREQAIHDIEDLNAADIMVYVNSMQSEGKATELGMAIATEKPVAVIGERDGASIYINLFEHVFKDVEEVIAELEAEDAVL